MMLMQMTLMPALKLLMDMIHLRSDAFQAKQDRKALHGQKRSFRGLELYEGKQFKQFYRTLNNCFYHVPDALPAHAFNRSTQSMMFRLLSRCGAVMHQLLAVVHRSSPFLLHAALVGDSQALCEAPPCVTDDLTKAVLQLYGSPAELEATDAQNLISALAEVMQCDIVRLETLHATRRIVNVHSCQTWSVAMEQLSADWFCRQVVALREGFLPVQPVPSRQRKRGRTVKQKKQGKITRNGGPWKAFVSQQCKRKGHKLLTCTEKCVASEVLTGSISVRSGKLMSMAAQHGVTEPRVRKRQSIADKSQAASSTDVEHRLQTLSSERRQQTELLKEEQILALAQEHKAQAEAVALVQQTLPPAGKDHEQVVTSGSFKCYAGNPLQPHVARFRVPADLLAKDCRVCF